MPRPFGLRALVALSPIACATGCQFLGGFASFFGPGPDAGLDAAANGRTDARVDASGPSDGGSDDRRQSHGDDPDADSGDAPPDAPKDAGKDGGTEAGATEDAYCGALPDRDGMVKTQVWDGGCTWIDQTEVTVAEYQAFLTATEDAGPPWNSLRPFCSWKNGGPASDPTRDAGVACTLPTPTGPYGYNPFDPSLPIRCVDWCDAAAYCEWAGKRLCWSNYYFNPFGSSPFGDPDVPEPDEWGGACAGPGGLQYPYGDTFEAGACQVDDDCTTPGGTNHCGPLAPGTRTECASPVGAEDMVGNVSEWVRYCLIPTPDASAGSHRSDKCAARGGDFSTSPGPSAQCQSGATDFTQLQLRDSTTAETGIRCCADAP